MIQNGIEILKFEATEGWGFFFFAYFFWKVFFLFFEKFVFLFLCEFLLFDETNFPELGLCSRQAADFLTKFRKFIRFYGMNLPRDAKFML